jgi:hypothetical protein
MGFPEFSEPAHVLEGAILHDVLDYQPIDLLDNDGNGRRHLVV